MRFHEIIINDLAFALCQKRRRQVPKNDLLNRSSRQDGCSRESHKMSQARALHIEQIMVGQCFQQWCRYKASTTRKEVKSWLQRSQALTIRQESVVVSHVTNVPFRLYFKSLLICKCAFDIFWVSLEYSLPIGPQHHQSSENDGGPAMSSCQWWTSPRILPRAAVEMLWNAANQCRPMISACFHHGF